MLKLIVNITKKEWYFLAIISIILIVIIITPTIYGFLIAPKEHQFTGLKQPHAGDYWVFFSRIEQSRQGHILHQYLYTSEKTPRVLFFPFWTIAGLSGRLMGLTGQQTFYFFEIILIPILVVSLYLLIGYFIKDLLWKKITLLVALFTTGSDWLLWPLFLNKYNWMGIDINLPDGHIFTAIHHSPHLSFLLICICFLFISLFLLVTTKKIIYSWLAGILGILIFLTHPFQVIPVLGIVGGYIIFEVFINKNYWLIKKFVPFVILVAISGFYLFLLWNDFDFIKNWNTENQVGFHQGLSSIFYLISTFSVFLFFSIITIINIIKTKKIKESIFLLLWVIIGFISIFLPIQWRGKMILGLSIPIAILGCRGLKLFLQKKSELLKITAFWIILILTLPSGLYLICYNITIYRANSNQNKSEYYFSNHLIESLNWLKNTPTDSIILSETYGPAIPDYAGRKVFLGHIYETINFMEKRQELKKFYLGELGVDFLNKYNINYLIDNYQSNTLNRDYLESVYSNSEVKIYKVIH